MSDRLHITVAVVAAGGIRDYNYSFASEVRTHLPQGPKPAPPPAAAPAPIEHTSPVAMPENGPHDAHESIMASINMDLAHLLGFGLRIADIDIAKSYPAPYLDPHEFDMLDKLTMVLQDLDLNKFTMYLQDLYCNKFTMLDNLTMVIQDPNYNKSAMLHHADERIREEIKKVFSGNFGFALITCPKNALGTLKECSEFWRSHVPTYLKIVKGMPRPFPSLNALETPTTSGYSEYARFILYFDSGAGHHVVHQAEMLVNLRDPPAGFTKVKAADGALLTVSAVGDLHTKDFNIPDVGLVKDLKVNLVSVGQLAGNHKVSCNFHSEGCEIISREDGSLLGSGVRRSDGQFVLSFLIIE